MAACIGIGTGRPLGGPGGMRQPAVRPRSSVPSTLRSTPGRRGDSSDYVPPQGSEADEVAAAALDLVEGRAPTVPRGYTVTAQKDVDVLAEEAVDGRTRGWGLYAVRRDSPSTVVVEVPHPRSDLLTEDIGAELFDSTQARALLVAGAHRSASDGVRRRRPRAGLGLRRTWTGPSCNDGWTVLQLHGFAEASHDLDAEAVVSSSEATPGPVVEAIAEALTRNGHHRLRLRRALVPGPGRNAEHAGQPMPERWAPASCTSSWPTRCARTLRDAPTSVAALTEVLGPGRSSGSGAGHQPEDDAGREDRPGHRGDGRRGEDRGDDRLADQLVGDEARDDEARGSGGRTAAGTPGGRTGRGSAAGTPP